MLLIVREATDSTSLVREAQLFTLLSLLNKERIPFEVEKAMAGMDTILRMTSYIANTVTDPGAKIQALSLMSEVYKQKSN
jgi:deoxycytidine triphosphate deaminase